MRKSRKIGFLVLAGVYLFLGFYIGVNLFNVQVSVFNPPDPNFFARYILFYPPYSGAIGTSNGQVILEVNLTANGRLVEGKQASISVAGSASYPLSANISYVSLSFQGAIPALNTSYSNGAIIYGPNFGKVVLVPNNFCAVKPTGIILDTILCGSPTFVIWPSTGAYSPILSIGFSNGTSQNETITMYSVAVLSSSFIQTEQSNRIDIAFSIALVTFGLMEGINIVYELTEKHHTRFSQR
jgi:hypothetical protein